MNTVTSTVGMLFQAYAQAFSLRWHCGQESESQSLRGSEALPGETLAGYLNIIHPNRIQVLGRHELAYLDALKPKARKDFLHTLFAAAPALVLLTEGGLPADDLLRAAKQTATPLLSSPADSGKVLQALQRYLGEMLAEMAVLHGVFMDVNGLGVLITGESGIGKSELALELINRHHRLIADDAPEFYRGGPDMVLGRCPGLLQDFLEVRGLGLLNVRAMFGDSAIEASKELRLIVHLQRMSEEDLRQLDRLRGSYQQRSFLDVVIPQVTIPVAPGRNLAVLVETAVRNHILLRKGYNASEAFIQRQREMVKKNKS